MCIWCIWLYINWNSTIPVNAISKYRNCILFPFLIHNYSYTPATLCILIIIINNTANISIFGFVWISIVEVLLYYVLMIFILQFKFIVCRIFWCLIFLPISFMHIHKVAKANTLQFNQLRTKTNETLKMTHQPNLNIDKN